MGDFGARFEATQQVLDIGCGNKPYQAYFKCEYIGLDPFPGTQADIVRDAWDTGLENDSMDGIVLNQSLEHISDTRATIQEVMRVLKPGGLVLVTVPQSMRNHTLPIPASEGPYKNFSVSETPYWVEDYWRFTKFGLIYLFKDFEITSLKTNQSYLSAMIQLWNYFLASFNIPFVFMPFYFINNLVAIILHKASSLMARISPRYKAFIHEGLTIDHTLIAKKY